MRIIYAHLKSVSPYSQSRPIQSVKSRDLTHDRFEEQTWKERCHVDSKKADSAKLAIGDTLRLFANGKD